MVTKKNEIIFSLGIQSQITYPGNSSKIFQAILKIIMLVKLARNCPLLEITLGIDNNISWLGVRSHYLHQL